MTSPFPVILITGANRGLGFATAQLLASRSPGCHVIVGARTEAKGTQAVAQLQDRITAAAKEGTTATISTSTFSTVTLDVTSDASVAAAAQTLASRHGRLDVLVNNAAVNDQGLDLPASLVANTATNVAGAARVTEAILPLLTTAEEGEGRGKGTTPPRLVFLSSVMASLTARADPTSYVYALPFVPYCASKAALNMLMLSYHRDLAPRGIIVFGVCPGFLATDITGPADAMREMGAIEAEQGAEVVVDVILGKRDGDAGRIVAAEGVHPW